MEDIWLGRNIGERVVKKSRAIKYAIASGLNITNNQEAIDKIQIYDAWKYTGEADVTKNYGYIVCDIDLDQGTFSTDMEDIVTEAVENVKAAGVSVQFIYHNFRIIYYIDLSDITYSSLSTMTYNKVGE